MQHDPNFHYNRTADVDALIRARGERRAGIVRIRMDKFLGQHLRINKALAQMLDPQISWHSGYVEYRGFSPVFERVPVGAIAIPVYRLVDNPDGTLTFQQFSHMTVGR